MSVVDHSMFVAGSGYPKPFQGMPVLEISHLKREGAHVKGDAPLHPGSYDTHRKPFPAGSHCGVDPDPIMLDHPPLNVAATLRDSNHSQSVVSALRILVSSQLATQLVIYLKT